ncbi:MAG TPA: hypothetical protein VK963_04125 [Candidatus Saccharimonadales bacterium]|nr:hypothetical protein [Candidatus Saccharimonadales bacterium]
MLRNRHFLLAANQGGINLTAALIVFLSFGVVLFGALSVISFSASQRATTSLRAATGQSYDQGRKDQKAEDQAQAEAEAQSPYRSYIAPAVYGGFEIKFPKNWNAYVVENTSATPLSLTLHPDFVKQLDGGDNVYATQIYLSRELYAAALRRYDEPLKKRLLTKRAVTVSGISGTWLEGKVDGRHDGVMVIVPVRDKVIKFSTDDKRFLDSFNQILAQAVITP